MGVLLLVILTIFCAYQVVRSARLLYSTLWLAATSALISLLLYILGAPEVAVIELSVGAGLVTVLFVFAFSITGEITFDQTTTIPRPLAIGFVLVTAILLGWFTFPNTGEIHDAVEIPFAQILWGRRGLDVLAQVIILFSGVLGLMGLLAETRTHLANAIIEPGTPDFIGLSSGHEILDAPSVEAPSLESPIVEAAAATPAALKDGSQ